MRSNQNPGSSDASRRAVSVSGSEWDQPVRVRVGGQMFRVSLVFFALAGAAVLCPPLALGILRELDGGDTMREIGWAYAYLFLALPFAALNALIGTALALGSVQRLGSTKDDAGASPEEHDAPSTVVTRPPAPRARAFPR